MKSSAPVTTSQENANWSGRRGLSPPAGGLCKFGLRPGVALARGQSNPGFSSVCKSGRQDSTRSPRLTIRWLQRMTHKETHKTQRSFDSDLQRVINAWRDLPDKPQGCDHLNRRPEFYPHRGNYLAETFRRPKRTRCQKSPAFSESSFGCITMTTHLPNTICSSCSGLLVRGFR